ncbi:OLC1v1015038C3 [Oldenlandia corymbosa var. corymbosa]|uniref:Protein FAR1-RELATED SEQUENCE n=1 Tax=Oldenlandia corymbosa var. corymbosa TaxID=529605 RepID=A0AAV1E2G5_OLDCO|nr:OLC1v1015038C3 [Oldenlandia corymbosa var. corymbosa]
MESSSAVGSSGFEVQEDVEFDSHGAAYEFYKEYAKSVGFGTAKLSSRRSRASREFIDAKFSCIRYGNKQQSDDAVNPRPSPKIGCKASMHVKRRQDGKWYIHSFVKEHNHELLPSQAHFFRSHMSDSPRKNDAKVRRRKILSSVAKPYGVYQLSSPIDNFLRNQHDRGRSLTLEGGDAQLLLELFVHMQLENPKFFYAVDFNEEHRLRNVFWVDAKGIEDYAYFNDVVLLDTAYFSNKYKLPLVLFIGANQHIQPILYGCALIADDTVFTFAWLMQTWCLAMGGLHPQVLLTDESNSMKTAVANVFPDTRHFISLFSILEKIPRQLQYLGPWHETFLAKFLKCVHKSWSEELFEKRWLKLVERFNLRDDLWMQSIYESRKLWVPTFIRDVSFSALSAASRCEGLNSFFDKYVLVDTSLKDLVAQFKLILEDRNEEEAKANFDAWHEAPEPKSPSPFEKQMSLVYTHEIFKKFQVEVLGAAACHLKKEQEDESSITYVVKDFENNEDFKVEWNEQKLEINCSCRSFQYRGYLCRHAIVVLQMSGVFTIPFKYILQRWTNAATSRHPISEKLDEVQAKVRRYNDLCRRAIILGEEGSLSLGSYTMALGAINEAMKQCVSANNSTENDLRTGAVATNLQDINQGSIATGDGGPPSSVVMPASKNSKRAHSGKERESVVSNVNKKGKVPTEQGASNVGSHGDFHQMDVHGGGLEYPNAYPRFFTTLLRTGEMNKKNVDMLSEMLEEQS